ncbi:hypothetical protein QBC47DRAFT_44729 [Echria macrotheca]|uniref:HAUS augmin-like complex subunit 1 n=1 Tax=Echria macrotheca TaxID=438768 RepID=A0AAJ0F4K7_9PEZI|nr:hypothetical protein QBC47DRAFT_44729 [Echria macrotheca]
MAHIPQAAIFSPSVARAAASTAKDWNFVDAWLHAKFHGRSAPPFERNADTLRALLALATANEAADEERQLVARLEATALQELRAQEDLHKQQSEDGRTGSGNTAADAREAILAAVRENLSREGTAALDAMATAAADCGIAFATPEDLGRRMTELPAQLSELEQMEARVRVLARYMESELQKMQKLAKELMDDKYRPPTDLAKQNLETQRKIKTLSARIPELRDKVSALANSVGTPNPTIEQVKREEEAYLALLSEKNELEAQVQAFQGLPHDTDQARQELEHLRNELRQTTQRRDAVFEGLVERETPKKPTRRP